MISATEKLVLDYLATSPDSFFSGREVCRKAASKKTWEDDQRWAIRVLSRLAGRGLVEANSSGHYRLARQRE